MGGHLDDRHLAEPVVVLRGELDDGVANEVVARLLYLQLEAPQDELRLVVTSPGGAVTAALAIYDAMHFVSVPLATYGVGQVAGIAALLVAAGRPGRRFLVRGARLALGHVFAENASELALAELERLRTHLFARYAHHTGRSAREVERLHGGGWLEAEQALDVGLADAVVEPGASTWLFDDGETSRPGVSGR
jgi:ATP-dependent Clp protease protease subunit